MSWLEVKPGDLVAVQFGLGRVRRLGLVNGRSIARGGQELLRVFIYSGARKAWTIRPRRVERREFVKKVGEATHTLTFGGRAPDITTRDLFLNNLSPRQIADALKEVRS